jgi:hypothetical protein
MRYFFSVLALCSVAFAFGAPPQYRYKTSQAEFVSSNGSWAKRVNGSFQLYTAAGQRINTPYQDDPDWAVSSVDQTPTGELVAGVVSGVLGDYRRGWVWTEAGGIVDEVSGAYGLLRATRGKEVYGQNRLGNSTYYFDGDAVASNSSYEDAHLGLSASWEIKGISQGGRWAATILDHSEYGGFNNLPFHSWKSSSIRTVQNQYITLQESQSERAAGIDYYGYDVVDVNDAGVSVGLKDNDGVLWGSDGIIRQRLPGFEPMDINDNGDVLGWQNGVFSMLHEGTIYSFQSLLANQQMPGTIDRQLSYFDTAGRFLVNGYLFEAVPEPSSMVVLGVGLLVLLRKKAPREF